MRGEGGEGKEGERGGEGKERGGREDCVRRHQLTYFTRSAQANIQ